MVHNLFVLLFSLLLSFSVNAGMTQPSLEKGSIVFKQRCTLCHGRLGMGEGLLAMALKNYPRTNLLEVKLAKTDAQIRNIVIWGSFDGRLTGFSPPWGSELSWTEIESVILFVKHLRNNTENAIKLLDKLTVKFNPSRQIGNSIFQGRCARCHGKTGKGDGEMAKIIKSPPPYNLTKSVMPDEYLRQIISRGGKAMQRSPKMPPWGDELSATELKSIILYLKSLRK